MKPTRRQVWTMLSTIYLLVLSALAAYALHTNARLSLPIHNIIPALTLALPLLAALALETSLLMTTTTRASTPRHVRLYALQVVSAIFLVYETTVSTLAGSHLAPVGSLTCALRERWTQLRNDRDEAAVRLIQDVFDCCGFQTVKDMSWPFYDDHASADACIVRFQRSNACVELWRGAEERVAGMLLAVTIGVFAWQMVFLYVGPERVNNAWLPSTIRLPQDTESASAAPAHAARRIAYRDEEESSVAGEVRRLNADSRLASDVERSRAQRLIAEPGEHNEWMEQPRTG